MKNVLSILNTIAAGVFEKPDLKLKTTDSPLEIDNWDSLTHVLLISAVENEFSIEFSFRDLAGIVTIGDLMNIIEKKISKTSAQ